MDVERRVAHRPNTGVEQYRSVAAQSQVQRGRRMVAAVANPTSHLSIPISSGIAAEQDAKQVATLSYGPPGLAPVGYPFTLRQRRQMDLEIQRWRRPGL